MANRPCLGGHSGHEDTIGGRPLPADGNSDGSFAVSPRQQCRCRETVFNFVESAHRSVPQLECRHDHCILAVQAQY